LSTAIMWHYIINSQSGNIFFSIQID